MKKILLSLIVIPALTLSVQAEEKELKRHEGIVSAIAVLEEITKDLTSELKTMIAKEGDKIDINKVLEVGEHVKDLDHAAKILHAADHYKREKGKM